MGRINYFSISQYFIVLKKSHYSTITSCNDYGIFDRVVDCGCHAHKKFFILRQMLSLENDESLNILQTSTNVLLIQQLLPKQKQ